MSVSFAVLASDPFQLVSKYIWDVGAQTIFIELVLLLAMGYAAMKVVFKVCGFKLYWWQAAAPTIGVASIFLGFAFAGAYYRCPICRMPPEYPAWCEVGIAGAPIPSRFFISDWQDVGPETEYSHSCDDGTGSPRTIRPNAATAANFVIGAMVLPLLVVLALKPWRRSQSSRSPL